MQDSKKDTDVYSGLLDSEGEGACFPAARVVMNIDDASLICHCSLSAMQPFPNRPWMGSVPGLKLVDPYLERLSLALPW